jgi:hypothetical protein
MPERHSSRARQAAQHTITCSAEDVDPSHYYVGPDLPSDWEEIYQAAEDVYASAMQHDPRPRQPVTISWDAFSALRRALGAL